MSRDRRRLRRYFKRIPAHFRCGTVQGRGYLRNLSKGGLFLRVDRLPPPRSPITVIIESPRGDKLEITGRVIWTTAELPNGAEVPAGFGMAVEGNEASYRAFFESLLLA